MKKKPKTIKVLKVEQNNHLDGGVRREEYYTIPYSKTPKKSKRMVPSWLDPYPNGKRIGKNSITCPACEQAAEKKRWGLVSKEDHEAFVRGLERSEEIILEQKEMSWSEIWKVAKLKFKAQYSAKTHSIKKKLCPTKK